MTINRECIVYRAESAEKSGWFVMLAPESHAILLSTSEILLGCPYILLHERKGSMAFPGSWGPMLGNPPAPYEADHPCIKV